MNARVVFAFAAGLAIGLAVPTTHADDARLPGVDGIFHFALVTTKYDEMKAFYTQKLGFPEAFTTMGRGGQPSFTYVQASKNTFIEIFPASATRQPGFSHFGLQVEDVNAVGDQLKARGVIIGGSRSGGGASTITLSDPDGNGIEVTQLGPDAPAHKAMDAWK